MLRAVPMPGAGVAESAAAAARRAVGGDSGGAESQGGAGSIGGKWLIVTASLLSFKTFAEACSVIIRPGVLSRISMGGIGHKLVDRRQAEAELTFGRLLGAIHRLLVY